MKVVELFAGIGGFRLAADSLGLDTVWANDISKAACAIYRDRFGSNGFVEGDIKQHIEELPDHDILTAGFPCQPFSSAGKKRGIEDPRGTLFQNIVDALVRYQPNFFVMENVKRLLSMHSGRHFATILDSLCGAGYVVEWRLLNAMDFGLPQNRQRVFILGFRDDIYAASEGFRLLDPCDIDATKSTRISIALAGELPFQIAVHGEKLKE